MTMRNECVPRVHNQIINVKILDISVQDDYHVALDVDFKTFKVRYEKGYGVHRDFHFLIDGKQIDENATPRELGIKDGTVIVVHYLTPDEKNARFYAAYQKYQNFALPASIMQYMAMNPSSPAVYQKLATSCKWFFVKNPIIVCHQLYSDFYSWTAINGAARIGFNLENVSAKLWVSNVLGMGMQNEYINYACQLKPVIYKAKYDRICLTFQTINVNDFLFFVANVKEIECNQVTVKNFDGSIVLLETIFKLCHNVLSFTYTFSFETFNECITEASAEKMIGISQFKDIKSLKLINIPEKFNVRVLFTFIKTTADVSFHLEFATDISVAYREIIDAFVDEVIADGYRQYKPPYIFYRGMDVMKFVRYMDIIYPL